MNLYQNINAISHDDAGVHHSLAPAKRMSQGSSDMFQFVRLQCGTDVWWNDWSRGCCVFVQVCLEMAKPEVPDDTTVCFSLEFVWKATSFERMNSALKLFKDYSASISGYLFHVLLGHEVSTVRLDCECHIPLPGNLPSLALANEL